MEQAADRSDSSGVWAVTWAVLLGRWMDFARSALALPDDAQGRRLRAVVPDIIALQAVWFALGEVGSLDADQRALGLDRASVLIEKHAASLHQRFAAEPLPTMLRELIADAQQRLGDVRAEQNDRDHSRD